MSNILKLLTFLADLFKKVSGIVAAQKVIDAKDQSLEERTKGKSKKHWVARVVLLALFGVGCSSASVKKRNEIWFIDPEAVVLYRVISEDKEQALPIKGNEDMRRFMCVTGDEFADTIREALGQ